MMGKYHYNQEKKQKNQKTGTTCLDILLFKLKNDSNLQCMPDQCTEGWKQCCVVQHYQFDLAPEKVSRKSSLNETCMNQQ